MHSAKTLAVVASLFSVLIARTNASLGLRAVDLNRFVLESGEMMSS